MSSPRSFRYYHGPLNMELNFHHIQSDHMGSVRHGKSVFSISKEEIIQLIRNIWNFSSDVSYIISNRGQKLIIKKNIGYTVGEANGRLTSWLKLVVGKRMKNSSRSQKLECVLITAYPVSVGVCAAAIPYSTRHRLYQSNIKAENKNSYKK